jgi:hypothetical protein
MAVEGDSPSHTPEVAARMGRNQSSVGSIRVGLIGKGLISPEHELIAFTPPVWQLDQTSILMRVDVLGITGMVTRPLGQTFEAPCR